MPKKITYRFLSKKSLDLFFAFSLSDTYIAWTNTTNAISFAFINQKAYYNKKH